MPWPMTLASMNEAVRRENHAEKTFDKEKINRHDPGGHERCKDSITIKKEQDFVRVGERGLEFIVLTSLLLIYRTLSINCITLWILSLSVLVPH